MMQEASMRMGERSIMNVKIRPNMMARRGGLRRMRRCAWREGMVLKKERPGMKRVWKIFGLECHECC